MEPTVVTLTRPIQYGSETITELRIRRPKAKDFRALPVQNQTMGDVLNLISRLTGCPPSVIDELDAEDLERVSEIVGNFMPAGPATGTGR